MQLVRTTSAYSTSTIIVIFCMAVVVWLLWYDILLLVLMSNVTCVTQLIDGRIVSGSYDMGHYLVSRTDV